jgi:hypothetical protein
MKQVQRRPYLTPYPDRVVIESWEQQIGEQLVPLGNRLPGWDPGTDIQVRAEVSVNVEGIYQDCRLERDAVLRLVLIWESSGTKLRGSGSVTDLSFIASSGHAALTAHIDGKLLADTVTLFVKLLFVSPGTTRHQLVPKLSGSILLETPPHKILLEGDGARFPIEVIDFTTTNFPHQAGWYLAWDPNNLEESLLGDVRLYVNSRHPQIAAAVSDIRPETSGIREAIRLDLAQTLIRGALQNPTFIENPERFISGTIGAAVRAMIRLYFDGYQLESVRELTRQPHEFSAYLQEKVKIFAYEQ